jgi:hypothetical protein
MEGQIASEKQFVMLNLFQHNELPPLRVIPKQVRDDDAYDGRCNFPQVQGDTNEAAVTAKACP